MKIAPLRILYAILDQFFDFYHFLWFQIENPIFSGNPYLKRRLFYGGAKTAKFSLWHPDPGPRRSRIWPIMRQAFWTQWLRFFMRFSTTFWPGHFPTGLGSESQPPGGVKKVTLSTQPASSYEQGFWVKKDAFSSLLVVFGFFMHSSTNFPDFPGNDWKVQ